MSLQRSYQPANNSGVNVLTCSRFITKAEKSNVVSVSSSNDSRGSCLLVRLLSQGASKTSVVCGWHSFLYLSRLASRLLVSLRTCSSLSCCRGCGFSWST
ncbi:hypothetical protein Tco_0325927, partial [Tanacetum coccineum]